MLKALLILTVSILFVGCNRYKPITIPLYPDDNTNKNLGIVRYLTKNEEPTIIDTEVTQRIGLDSVSVAVFDHSPQKYGDNMTDSKSRFIIGRKGDSIIIIPDENNNNRIDDDRMFALHRSILLSQSIDTLEKFPSLEVSNLQTIYNDKIYIFSRKFFLLPDTIRTGHLTLNLISNEQSKGKFKYRGKKYIIKAKQVSSGQFVANTQNVNIRIGAMKNNIGDEYSKNNILHIYDTAKVGNRIFVVQNISTFLDSVVLTPMKPNSFSTWASNVKRAQGNENILDFKGKSYPYLKYLLDTSDIAKGESKVLFINFWFSSCPPCIAEFKGLTSLYQEFKNDSSFQLVSLTFESQQEIENIRKKYSLPFEMYSLSNKEISKLSLSNLFPTNIIIDKDGIVTDFFVGGETETDKTLLFFEEIIIPKISKLLNSI